MSVVEALILCSFVLILVLWCIASLGFVFSTVLSQDGLTPLVPGGVKESQPSEPDLSSDPTDAALKVSYTRMLVTYVWTWGYTCLKVYRHSKRFATEENTMSRIKKLF